MLISTKINPPQPKSNLLNRKQLIDRLIEGDKCQLILITAPAGYGKTSLASQWANSIKPVMAWYSIDDTDNDFDIFFRYFIAALIEAEEKLKEELGPLLQDRNLLTADDVIPSIIHSLNTLAGDLYIVLDDYHIIVSEEIHRAFAKMLKYLPPKIHLVVITRYKLPQSLYRFRCQYDTVEITANDLRFSEEEGKDFFRKVIPLDLTSDQIRELTCYTGGWVTGFQIFALSMAGEEYPFDSGRMHKIVSREATDYLLNEVVKIQSDEIKTFLLHTAVLTRLNADLCHHITGMSGSEKILNDLHRKNLFLVPLDSGHTWYRYHQLFSETLRNHVKISSPELLVQSQKKAAEWCAQNHLPEEAFQYALASGDVEFLADLLEVYLTYLLNRSEFVMAHRWISKLPRHIFLQRHSLRITECMFKILKMQLNEASLILPEIEKDLLEDKIRYEAKEKSMLKELLICVKSMLEYFKNMANPDIRKMTAEIDTISKENRSMAGYIRILIAQTYFLLCELPLAEEQMKMASADIFHNEENFNMRMNWNTLMALMMIVQGQLARGEKILSDTLSSLKGQNMADTPSKYFLYLPMSLISLHRNELDQALELANLSVKYVERTGMVSFLLSGYSLISHIWLFKGDFQKAAHFAGKSKLLAESLEYPNLHDLSDVMLNLISLSQNNVNGTPPKSFPPKMDPDEPFSLPFIDKTIIFAGWQVQQGNLQAALSLLEDLRKKCMKKNILLYVLEIDVFLAGIYGLMGKKEEAFKLMKHAISFSEKEGVIRPFVGNAPLVVPLLKEFIQNSNPLSQSSHFKKLYEACVALAENIPEPSTTPKTKNAFGLTEREVEILRFMSEGYKYQQIADKAFISLTTVKSHVQHIFKKLDVNSRSQAVITARDFLHP